jgi:serine/threonine protein phosphatase PrpC
LNCIISASTDIGQYRESNQDSVCVKYATWQEKNVIMAIVCDGMGGLSNGELASATVVRAFAQWFENQLPKMIKSYNVQEIASIWVKKLFDLSEKIKHYGAKTGASLGTTFSGMFIMGTEYVIVHVGDTRIYEINNTIRQITTDHTYIAREISAGRMTESEARYHPKRSTLLQCIGASKRLEPEVIFGTVKMSERFVLCSDGFRHKLTNNELLCAFSSENTRSQENSKKICQSLIQKTIQRGEKDNITVVILSFF